MLRRTLLASAGVMALTGAGFAADLPYRGPPPVYPPPPPIYTWSGLYLGGQIGYAWGNDPSELFFFKPGIPAIPPDGTAGTPAVPAISFNDPFSNSSSGVIGGAHIGYNLQFAQWVVGLEGSVDGTSVSGNVFDPNSGITVRTRADVQGSIRARAGIAFDRVLLYATGGAAFAGIDSNYTDTTGAITTFPGTAEKISQTRSGWTVGGGIEYAVTNNWSIRAEYRYSDFGHFNNFPFTALVPAGGTLFVRHHLTENQVQAGFSYKFDSFAPGPVVAKY